MLHYRKAIGIFRKIFDSAALALGFWIALHVRFGDFGKPLREVDFLVFFVLLGIWFISAKFIGLYDEFRSRNFGFEVITVIRQVIILTISMIILLFSIKDVFLSRVFIFSLSLLVLIFQIFIRLMFRAALISWRKRGRNLRNMIIVGAGKTGREFSDLIERNPNFGYVVNGFVDNNSEHVSGEKYLGKIENLDGLLSEMEIDIVMIALSDTAPEKVDDVIHICERHTTRIKIVPDYFRFVSGKYNVSMFDKFPVISVRDDRINETHWRLIKRWIDISFSLFIFIGILSWTLPIIAILIKLNSRGPILYKQERWGRNNKKFRVYKFRTMNAGSGDVDENGKYRQAKRNDPRITSVGRFLRGTNLDELPQFFNVLKGDMSIVGPRPHPTPLNIEAQDKYHLYMYRHIVKPGITGWAQVNGFRGETEESFSMQKRVDHDIWYIENWSLWLDIQIIIITIFNMMKGEREAF